MTTQQLAVTPVQPYAGPRATRRVVWLRNVPAALLPDLRRLGYHTGLDRDPTYDYCRGLRAAMEERSTQKLIDWINCVGGEADRLQPGAVPAVWIPNETGHQEGLLRYVCGDHLEIRSGATLAEVTGDHTARQLVTKVQQVHPLKLNGHSPHNGALLPLNDGLFLLVFRYYNESGNRMAACLLDASCRVVPGSENPNIGLNENIDPRLVWHDGKAILITAYHMGHQMCRMELRELPGTDPTKFNAQTLECRTVLDASAIDGFPDFPGGDCQKNWIPFSHDGKLLLIYKICPHLILELDPTNTRARLSHAVHWSPPHTWDQQKWGSDLRGSGCPVRLRDGTYLGSFHTVVGGRYYTGFYRFEGAAPFRVVSMSRRPVIGPLMQCGHNPFNGSKVIFIVSMQIEGETIRLAGGDNDIRQIVMELSLPEVLSKMEFVHFAPLARMVELKHFESIEASEPRTDRELLASILQPEDENADFVSTDRNYLYYRAIGLHFRPSSIGEIGVRFGYSLYAMAIGSTSGRDEPRNMRLRGWDGEIDGISSSDRARKAIADAGFTDFQLRRADTQKMDALEESGFDLFHVDGCHTDAGASHDMELAWNATRPGGVILVDDYESTLEVRHAVDRFVSQRGAAMNVLGTFRGLAIIQR